MTKKAVLVGINYTSLGKGVLRGCINDVNNMKAYIIANQGYTEKNMMILVDAADTPAHLLPTHQNITNALKWLVQDAQPTDRLFFHYSGHGGLVNDTDGDEADGKDETLCPLDYSTAGQITDDDLHKLLIQKLPQGTRLTCVTDCCHSGTILDLPYVYKSGADGKVQMNLMEKAQSLIQKAQIVANSTDMEQKKEAATGIFNDLMLIFSSFCGSNAANQTVSQDPHLNKETTKKGGEVFLITGCQDNQTSADAMINSKASGALTYGLLKVLNESQGKISYEGLLLDTRKCLEGQYTQIPQLCVGVELDIKNVMFEM